MAVHELHTSESVHWVDDTITVQVKEINVLLQHGALARTVGISLTAIHCRCVSGSRLPWVAERFFQLLVDWEFPPHRDGRGCTFWNTAVRHSGSSRE